MTIGVGCSSCRRPRDRLVMPDTRSENLSSSANSTAGSLHHRGVHTPQPPRRRRCAESESSYGPRRP
jgi:hypothetical protein